MHTPVAMLRERRVSPPRVTLVALGLVPAGAIGAVLSPFGAGWLTGALAGFVLSAAHLWWRGRRPSAIR